MAQTPSGYLRKPAAGDQVAPALVLELAAAVEAAKGRAALDALLVAAGIAHLPRATEPIPQSTAQRMHRALRDTMPDAAHDLSGTAGQATADSLMASQLSPRAKAMLQRGPWTVAAWLLGRWALQNSWTFAGSARFTPVAKLEFELAGNPLIAGERATQPLCIFHEAMFERLFQRLVEPNLICREVECEAMGAPACRFVVGLA